MSTNYTNEIAAAKALLLESTQTLVKHGVAFVVVGGWSPFLFHSDRYGHPGTFDVDILLHSDSLDDGTFERASEELLLNGYLRAPKNAYQAHRILSVNGEEFVFHVDFLNERDPENAIELVGGTGRMKSIYTDSMKAVFKYENYRTHLDYKGVHFPSAETFVVTKAAAVAVKKRKRDAFDIFVTVKDQDPIAFKNTWQYHCKDGLFIDATEALIKAVRHGDAVEKIQAILSDLQAANLLRLEMPTKDEIQKVFTFLDF